MKNGECRDSIGHGNPKYIILDPPAMEMYRTSKPVLRRRERRVMRMVERGYSHNQIGRMFGVPESRVPEIYQGIVIKLRELSGVRVTRKK